ncbi:RBM17 [Bugula neritina]|uniref:Splicing factor 45 n=1 Tax=Bugula neritina TaxID=10212 RepID=A0A7J7KTD9_BUGNE|nr:RBM17 [Bugula neritina]
MSLYDDIDLDNKSGDAKSDISGWSVGHKLLHSHSKSKKSAMPSSSQSKKRQNSALAPVVDLNSGGGMSYGGGGSIAAQDGEIRFNHITGKMEAGPMPRSYAQLGMKTYPLSSPFADMSIEYDPGFPNEYSDFSKRLKKLRYQEREREEQEQENERRKESEERQKRREDERKERLEKIAASFKPPPNLYNESPKETESTKRLALYDSSSDSDDDEKNKYNNKGNMEFAPPPSLVEESKPMTPPSYSSPLNQAAEDELTGFKIEGKGGSVASKIMAKMGYRQGSGLGRDEQGMSRALQVEKTSRRGGKILHEKDIASKEMSAAGGPVKSDTGVTHTELLRNPSKVLLLTNMVGPGEVDNELEPETAEECSKYGKVIKCVIYELQNVPEVLAVRIFVEFEKISFAIKAAIDLNGRYFGGRVVRASFYSHEKFLEMKLDDDPL